MVPDQRRLLAEIQVCLKPGGKLLVAEPKIHVPSKAFQQTVALAGEVGLKVVEEPSVRGCRAVVFSEGRYPMLLHIGNQATIGLNMDFTAKAP